MDENEVIDLREFAEIIRNNIKTLAAIVVGTISFMTVMAYVLPKEYESVALIKAKTQKSGGISMQAAAAVALLGGVGVGNPVQGYVEMLKSRSVLEPVIAKLDLPPEKKEKLDNEEFAKKYLEIKNPKGTDLIEITAKGRTPEEARDIAVGVLENFQALLTRLNQTEQSILVKFLSDRLDIAKKEMEQAERDLENFRQKAKIFVPDEQAKAMIAKLTAFDKRLAEIEVENQANTAKLASVNEQLNKHNVLLKNYNVADNPAIQQIRSQIIAKQMELVALEQRYTDKHPAVVLAKTEIDELSKKLRAEVERAVQAGTTTLNPVHSGLLTQKVTAETELAVGSAAADAVRQARTASEKEISRLSAESLTYIGLERQVAITREVYAVLVKNYEQARIQEAMESMDIQVVDMPDVPKKHSWPRKILFVALGLVLGIMAAGTYVIVKYIRRDRAPTAVAVRQ